MGNMTAKGLRESGLARTRRTVTKKSSDSSCVETAAQK